MPKRSSKRRDANETAFSVVAQATGQAPKDEPQAEPEEPSADAVRSVMAAMGRKGGLKGGKARAARLSAAKRKAIAKKAARARWDG
jgi:hypothetical protein